jgi:hypothetical protein
VFGADISAPAPASPSGRRSGASRSSGSSCRTALPTPRPDLPTPRSAHRAASTPHVAQRAATASSKELQESVTTTGRRPKAPTCRGSSCRTDRQNLPQLKQRPASYTERGLDSYLQWPGSIQSLVGRQTLYQPSDAVARGPPLPFFLDSQRGARDRRVAASALRAKIGHRWGHPFWS